MATDTRTATFVTGAAGFIGLELVKLLVARRRQVSLLEPGPWHDEAGSALRRMREGFSPARGAGDEATYGSEFGMDSRQSRPTNHRWL